MSFRRGGREKKYKINSVAIEVVIFVKQVCSLPGRLHAGGGTFMDTE